jgi:hypothetical protein
VNCGVAVTTFLAVIVALFGDWFRAFFRAKFWPPVLRLTLLSAEGLPERIHHPEEKKDGLTLVSERFEDARYYHVRISNDRRKLSPAKDVRVMLLRVEEPGPGGTSQITWTGEMQMTWRNQQLYPLAREIGSEADCDLCMVGKDGWLALSVISQPFSLPALRKDACSLIVSLQVRSAEVDSPIHRISIAWDGRWADGESEMKKHLVVAELTV